MTPDFNQLHGVWNGRVKGSQPLHQLIPMATRSSTRHRLIWLSPQLVEVVLQNLLSILGHPLADAVLVLLHSQRSGSLKILPAI
jgi:hypothetical protein